MSLDEMLELLGPGVAIVVDHEGRIIDVVLYGHEEA